MLDVSEDRAGTGLQAIATGLGASAESRPARHLAVDRAALGVAHTVFLRRAFITAVLGSDVHVVVATLRTGATALGAGSPGVPGVLAVDGARMSVARLGGRYQTWACYTTVLSEGDDGSRAGVDTTATEL